MKEITKSRKKRKGEGGKVRKEVEKKLIPKLAFVIGEDQQFLFIFFY